MRAWWSLAFLLFGACASVRPADPRAAVEAVVEAQYRAVEKGDLEAWADAFAPDAVLFGTDAGETMQGAAVIRARVAEGARTRMRPDVQRTYRSQGRRHVGLDPDRRAAWVADEIDYAVTSTAGTRRYTFRVTELIAERGGRWEILAAHYSVPVPDEVAFAARWVSPAPIEATPGSPATLFPSSTAARFAGAFGDHPATFLFGTAPEERVIGGAAVRAFVHQDEPGGSIQVTLTGGAATGLSSSGGAAWLAYTAQLSVRGATLPVRVLAVFLREGEAWAKVQEHVSLPAAE